MTKEPGLIIGRLTSMGVVIVYRTNVELLMAPMGGDDIGSGQCRDK